MNKNYYEILEINRNASQEIVEKAYKTLAKKYHPDLQEGSKKTEFEEKLKIINEAYEVLSDPQRRKEYDATLPQNVSAEDYENLYRQKEYMKERITRMEQEQSRHNPNAYGHDQQNGYNQGQPVNNWQSQQQYSNQQLNEDLARKRAEYEQQMNNAINKAYHDAYINDLKRRGYRIKYKKTMKDYLAALITVVVIVILIFILWHIPSIHDSLVDFYNNNFFVHFIVDIFINFFKAIGSIFKK